MSYSILWPCGKKTKLKVFKHHTEHKTLEHEQWVVVNMSMGIWYSRVIDNIAKDGGIIYDNEGAIVGYADFSGLLPRKLYVQNKEDVLKVKKEIKYHV